MKPAAHIVCRAPEREVPSSVASVRQASAEQGHRASARERRVRGTQEAETVTGRVRREANLLVDTTSMCATESNTHQERSDRDKKKQKSAQKSLTIAAT